MAFYIGWGTGSSGDWTTAGSTLSPIDAQAAGTFGTRQVSAVNPSIAAGQLYLLVQVTGAGAGSREIIRVESYNGSVITTTAPLDNTYTTSGTTSLAIISHIPEYKNININGTVVGKSWTGSVGGHTILLANGTITVNASLTVSGSNGTTSGGTTTGGGFRGGATDNGTVPNQGTQGDGTGGLGSGSINPNGNGGGGGETTSASQGSGGGGGGYASAGANAQSEGGANFGRGGSAVGTSSVTGLFMGGGGGGGSNDGSGELPGSGGSGGAAIVLIAPQIIIGGSGSISSNGGDGGDPGSGTYGGGGGGAGGTIHLMGITGDINTDKLFCIGGQGGDDTRGADGSNGRIRLDFCSLTGSVSASNYGSIVQNIGGNSWCGLLSSGVI